MAIVELDLTGVRCPLNWAKAKVRLESLGREETLALWIDDPRGVRDIPRAAAAEGYDVIDVELVGARWKILIQR